MKNTRQNTLSAALLAGIFLTSSACQPIANQQENPTTRRAQPLAEATDEDPAPERVRVTLEAAPNDRDGWRYAYNGSNPGPTIRATRGDTVEVELINRLGAGTTIHWHGLKVPFEMDGVAWRGEAVGDGARSLYRFQVQQAGTFWYHPHFNTDRQVDGGLYGALIVEDPDEPRADQDLTLIFDVEAEFDPRAPRHDHGHSDAPGDQADATPRAAHGHGRLRPRWRVNGAPAPLQQPLPGGQVVRARLINASNAAYLALRWPDMRVIALDQGLLSAPISPERLVLGPGDRAEVEWRVGAEGFALLTDPWSLNGGAALGEPTPLVQVQVAQPAPAPPSLAWPDAPRAPSADPGHTDVLYSLQGSDRSGAWLINGERFPDITIAEVPFDQELVLEVRNLSPTEHPFHLHGLTFELLSRNGEPPPLQQIEDTINLGIRDTVRLLVRADNPGDWMTHCHILPHAEDGMMTVLRVLPP
jgi:FtsP/CotA-like multicopper oxidase with cupredoxin domain